MFGRLCIPYKWVKVYTGFLMVCVLLGNDFLKFSLGGFPFNLYRIVGLAAPVVLLLAPAAFWRTLWRDGARYYALFVGLLCGDALLSGLWVPDRSLWMSHTSFLLYGGLTTFLVLGCLDSRGAVMRALRLFVLCAAVVAVGALIEMLSGHYWFNTLYVEAYVWAASRSFMHLPLPVFTMGNVNDFGSYLFFAMAAVLYLAVDGRGRRCRCGRWRLSSVVWYVVAGLLFLFVILCTQSRSVFLALILAGTAGFGCFLLQRPPYWKWWLGLACGVMAVAVAGFVWFWRLEAADYSNAVRWGVIRNAWMFFEPVWYRGLGWGGIDYYNSQYPIYTVGIVPNLHNWFLEILFSCGLFVFLYYLWVYIQAWWLNLRRVVPANRHTCVSADPTRRLGGCLSGCPDVWRAAIVVATMSGFFAISIASSSFVSAQWFWAVGALGFGVAGYTTEKAREGGCDTEEADTVGKTGVVGKADVALADGGNVR